MIRSNDGFLALRLPSLYHHVETPGSRTQWEAKSWKYVNYGSIHIQTDPTPCTFPSRDNPWEQYPFFKKRQTPVYSTQPPLDPLPLQAQSQRIAESSLAVNRPRIYILPRGKHWNTLRVLTNGQQTALHKRARETNLYALLERPTQVVPLKRRPARAVASSDLKRRQPCTPYSKLTGIFGGGDADGCLDS